jgi:hypothetical protein
MIEVDFDVVHLDLRVDFPPQHPKNLGLGVL